MALFFNIPSLKKRHFSLSHTDRQYRFHTRWMRVISPHHLIMATFFPLSLPLPASSNHTTITNRRITALWCCSKMHTTRSSSPFVKPITPSGVANNYVNPNWASWSAGCRIVETGGGSLPDADAVLSDEDRAWTPEGPFPHHILLHFPSHSTIRYMGWAASTSHSTPKSALFYSGETPETLQTLMKCQTLPGSGVQVWSYPEGIPASHSYVKVVFLEPFEDSQTTYGLQRLFLFDDEPNIKQAQPRAAESTSTASRRGSGEEYFDEASPAKTDPKRSPSPPDSSSNSTAAVRRRQFVNMSSPSTSHISTTGSKLQEAMEGLDQEVRRLHKVRATSPLKIPPQTCASSRSVSPHPDSGTAHYYHHEGAERAHPVYQEQHVSHPSARRAETSKEEHFLHQSSRLACVEADPVWMTVFRSYDDRLARCENQVQRILALLELQNEGKGDDAAKKSTAAGSGGGGGVSSSTVNRSTTEVRTDRSSASLGMSFAGMSPEDFPSEEMQLLVLNWVKPTMQKWAKQIEKKITRALNSKIDESFEKITKDTIDRKVQEMLDGLSTAERDVC